MTICTVGSVSAELWLVFIIAASTHLGRESIGITPAPMFPLGEYASPEPIGSARATRATGQQLTLTQHVQVGRGFLLSGVAEGCARGFQSETADSMGGGV
jgi:hypothetical protein